MTAIVKPLSIPSVALDSGSISSSSTRLLPSNWQDLVAKYESALGPASTPPVGAPTSAPPLMGLLKMQMEVFHYQLKVEMVSKVAESAVTSLRKLQQPQ